MNLIDAMVTKIIGIPRLVGCGNTEWWQLWVEYVDDGGTSEKYLTFNTEQEANEVKPGYEFTH